MKDTAIQWVDHSWSPWIGCSKVSPGCLNCYAEHLMDTRLGRVRWGPGNPRSRTSAKYWAEPARWNRNLECLARCTGCGRSGPASSWDEDVANEGGPAAAACCPDNSRIPEYATVFPSLCDWLDPEVPAEWLADFMGLVHRTPNLRWLLLTKRPELWRARVNGVSLLHPARELSGGWDPNCSDVREIARKWVEDGTPPPNVAVGVSAEDQTRWDERVLSLVKIPARWRFVSVEPMLGPIDMRNVVDDDNNSCDPLTGDWGVEGRGHTGPSQSRVHQVIFGGESGPGARPCHVDWVRGGLRQCREAGVKAFVKQLGSNAVEDLSAVIPEATVAKDAEDEFTSGDVAHWEHSRHNNPMCLKHPKGGEPAEWPEDIRVREVLS